MITQTIQSFAVQMSESGIGNYVIIDLTKVASDTVVPGDLPHGISGMVDTEKTAIEFVIDEADEDNHAGSVYQEIVRACRENASSLRGTITLIEDGEVETTSID